MAHPQYSGGLLAADPTPRLRLSGRIINQAQLKGVLPLPSERSESNPADPPYWESKDPEEIVRGKSRVTKDREMDQYRVCIKRKR